MRIERLDPMSDRDLDEAAALETAYLREVLGDDEPAFPREEVRHGLLHATRDDVDGIGLLARDGGRGVGLAILDIRHGHGNEHMAWCPELYVLPGDRRRGVGRALVEEVVAVATAAGRTLVIGGHAEGHEGGAAFAAALGAEPGNSEAQNRLRLERLDRGLMARWIDAAAERAGGYSLVGFDDRCPDELLDAFVRIQNVMNTAPRPDSLEEFLFTAGHRRQAEREREAAGRRQWVVCARHDASGEIVGYTEITFGPHRPWLAEQGDTAVDPAHRNRGLGRWLKAVNALRLVEERPEATVLETWNDGTNAPMLAINTEMGFAPVAVWRDAELTLR